MNQRWEVKVCVSLAAAALGVTMYLFYRLGTSETMPPPGSDADTDANANPEFQAATELARELSLDTETMLKLYGLYKRSCVGVAPQQGPWEPLSRAKWTWWSKCSSLTQAEAMKAYIDLVEELCEQGKAKPKVSGPTMSRMVMEDSEPGPLAEFECQEEFERIREDFDHLSASMLLQNPKLVTLGDDETRTLLHWAVDSDHVEAVRLLIEHGADVNAKDSENETPLAYAVCSNLTQVSTLLLDAGANPLECCSQGPASGLTSQAALKELLKQREKTLLD